MSGEDLDALLRHSRENNLKHGVTGVLLYVDGCFMQVLEGEQHVIDALYSKILIDGRHTRITQIIQEAIPHRYFGEWTMGLSTLTRDELAGILDAGSFEDREQMLSCISEGRAKKLLRAFAEGRWRTRIGATSGKAA